MLNHSFKGFLIMIHSLFECLKETFPITCFSLSGRLQVMSIFVNLFLGICESDFSLVISNPIMYIRSSDSIELQIDHSHGLGEYLDPSSKPPLEQIYHHSKWFSIVSLFLKQFCSGIFVKTVSVGAFVKSPPPPTTVFGLTPPIFGGTLIRLGKYLFFGIHFFLFPSYSKSLK